MSQYSGRYVVTGGAGFIGSHLCEALLSEGAEVVCIDNLITGSLDNIREMESNPKFKFHNFDIIEEVNIDGGVAGIFHMASPASPIDYQKHPIETLRVGSIGSDNILNFAREKKCPILVASTSEVYGDPQVNPQPESYWGNVNPIGPRSCYDESKRYMEALTMTYFREYEVPVRIIRIFNTYGPKMRANDGRVVPNFCLQALKNEEITIYGSGNQTRSFCYVSDLVAGILKRFLWDDPNPVNLGNPVEMTIKEFSEEVIRLTNSKSKLSFHPLPTDDPQLRRPDITLAKKVLEWEPEVLLADGLAKTIEYFKNKI